MATYALVGGAWLGGWCWQPIARRLREQGHDVYPVTLTGLGERVHLAAPEVNLDTHITDIVNLIEFEDLHDVLLLGHSYGGMPVTGVSDRIPERIARVLYLDSGPMPSGLSFLEANPPPVQQLAERYVAQHGDGWRYPMPTWEELEQENGAGLVGLGERERAAVQARAVPQPFGTYTQPLTLTNPAREALPKVGILCTFTEALIREMIATGHPWAKGMSGPEWRFVEMPTSHWPMFSAPERLIEVLLDLAADAPAHPDYS